MPNHFELSKEARDYIEQEFPEAVIVGGFKFGDIRDQRLRSAGIGLAEIILSDSRHQLAAYTHTITPTSAWIDFIETEEELGLVAPGSRDEAINAVINDEFYIVHG